MSKKDKRVRYELNANGIKSLPESEIKTILRGADDLVMSGGRAMLAKILAGSKDKKLLELELDSSPVYGSFKGVSQKEILAKIDWMILHDYLEIEYDYRLPLLIFTDKGWEIERETYAEELMNKLMEAADKGAYEFVETLKDRNRDMILLLLEKVAQSSNKDFITILKSWKGIEYKKVRTAIQEVVDVLENGDEDTKMNHKPEAISFTANKKWLAIPAEFRRELERNVWCVSCSDVVKIENYVVKEATPGILLEGKCQKCGHDVARFIEVE
jgi:hypothetical protein